MKSKFSKFLLHNIKSFYVILFVVFSSYTIFSFSIKYDLSNFEALQYDKDALDFALNWRFSGPESSDDVVIIEIDERSLDALADEYGRWPWPRSIFADLIFGLEESGPKSIFLNVLFTDPDLRDPDSDFALDFAISEYDNLILPAVRLNRENDKLSEVKLSQLPFVHSYVLDEPVAVLIAFFPSSLSKLALNNLILDEDGVVRRAQYFYKEENTSFRTIASRQAELNDYDGNLDIDRLINWSNDEGYKTFSFSDVYQALINGDEKYLSNFSGKNLIIGLTAPGISIQRPTPFSPYTDDNHILASQLDSLVYGKGLKTVPPLLIMIATIMSFAFFATAGYRNWDEDLVDYSFFGFELISIAISIISISYSNYFIDLSYPITAAGLFFILTYAYRYPVNNRLAGKNNYLLFEELNQNLLYSILLLSDAKYESRIYDLKQQGQINDIYELDDFVSSDVIFGDVFDSVQLLVCFHDEPIARLLDPSHFVCQELDLLIDNGTRQSLSASILTCYLSFLEKNNYR